jgi:hypothetical protein
MAKEMNWNERPECERAYSFDTAFCTDPNCGLHMIAKREDDSAICEIVMSAEQTLKLVQYIKDVLYMKKVEEDGEG